MRLLTAVPSSLGVYRKTASTRYVSSVLLFLCFYLPVQLFAQGNINVKGKVTEESGAGLSGVTVTLKGTNNRVVSDNEGQYSISAPSNGTLLFSYVGYENKEAKINNQQTVNISLPSLSTSLTQVVVVGYGTQRRANITGAVSSVAGRTLSELPVPSVSQALQGRVAGVTVTNNGTPGSSPIVQIRGISSISYGSDPLYVVDGFPMVGGIGSLDSRDIQSVDVLKDASAAAIYGSRATNGVIIVTTKKGARDGKAHITLDSYVGTEKVWNTIDLLNTQQYLQYERMLNGNANIGLPPRLQTANFNQPIYQGSDQTFAETNTDWQDAYFRRGLITQHNVGISGGNDISRYYTSAGYFKQEGIAQGANYDRLNFRINSDHNLGKLFTFGQNLFLAYSKQRFDNTGGNRTRLVNVIRELPYLPVYDPTTQGGFRDAENSFDGADPTNPVADAVLLGSATNKTVRTFGTAYAQVNFTSWLNFRSTFGVDYSNNLQHQFTPIYNTKGRNSTTAAINDLRTATSSLLYTQQLSFDKTFGVHHINAIAVFERQDTKSSGERGTGNQASNLIQTLVGATNTSVNSQKTDNTLLSYVGRVNYDFSNKYLLSAAIRRDGFSIWAPGKKYANFPSFSAGWRIDQEDFMKGQDFISELKLRGGWGETGLNAQGIFPYPAGTTTLFNNDYPYQQLVNANAATYPFNNTNSVGNASFSGALASEELNWEKTKQTNIGLDLGLFRNKVTLVAEWYRRQTDNLILNPPTPPSFGFGGVGAPQNIGSMKNTGMDFQLGYNQNQGAFTWNATALVSFVRNKILSLNTPTATIDQGADQDFGGNFAITRTIAGQPVQSFYGWLVDGIFQTQADVDKAAVQVAGKTSAGDIKFTDMNSDNSITDADRTFLGSYIPKFSYSLNWSGRYKNFDASIFFQGVQGNKIFNAAAIIREGMARLFNSGTNVLNAWTPTNTNTDVPRAISGDPNLNARVSNRWIEDGSYLRLKNVIIGYTIPANTLGSISRGAINNVRVYVSSQNLLTFTDYSGWDPEIGSKNGTLTNGVDYGQYPAARSFQFGLQVGF